MYAPRVAIAPHEKRCQFSADAITLMAKIALFAILDGSRYICVSVVVVRDKHLCTVWMASDYSTPTTVVLEVHRILCTIG